MKLSIVICTLNPNPTAFARVLEALRKQTTPASEWELVVIDNGSTVPLSQVWAEKVPPSTRFIVEPKLGLTWARLRGFRETKSEIVLMVDDDNVLNPDYVENVLRIGEQFPQLGAWGAATIVADYEVPPPEWFLEFQFWLCIRDEKRDTWSNVPGIRSAQPVGGGMALRRSVMVAYAKLCEGARFHTAFDRRGRSLASSGDLDLLILTTELGLGYGSFRSLRYLHVLPKHRTKPTYLYKLIEEATVTNTVCLLGHGLQSLPPRWKNELKLRMIRLIPSALFRPATRVELAEKRGRARARVKWQTLMPKS